MRKTISLPALCVILAVLVIAVTPAWADESRPSATSDIRPSEHYDATPSGKSGKTTSANISGEPIYVHLEPIVLPVISDTGVDQLVTIRIDLEATNFDACNVIREHVPRIMDAIVTSLYGGLEHGSLRNGQLVDVNKVRARARAAVQGIVGNDTVTNVLIQGVSQRML